MQRTRLFIILCLSGLGVALAAERPVAVSPGDVAKLAPIGDRCPTFSWGAVFGAESYELVVYRLGDEGEEARRVLRRSFAGSVSGWTPSLDLCFERGGRYAWSVRTVGEKATSAWSRPSLFRVTSGPSEAEFEAALQTVRSYLGARAEVPLADSPAGTGDEAEEEAAADTEDTASTPSGPAPPPELTVDGGVMATSFSGDGSALTALDPVNLSAGTAAIDISGSAASADDAGLFGGSPPGFFLRKVEADTETELETLLTDVSNVLTDSETAATASALALDGTNCPAGQVALGVDAAGNAQGCAPAFAAVSCPPGQVLFGFDSDGTPACTAVGALSTPPTAQTVSTVASTVGVFLGTSLALGADGLPVVSYYDNGDLEVAKCNDPACDPTVNGAETLSIVDATGDVGEYSSIVLGADGLPVMSYYDQTAFDLKVAKCNDPACDPSVNGAETVSTVDSAGNVGLYTSIALGADGLPIVSYWDLTNDDLKVAKCNDPACDPTVNGAETLSTVDSAEGVGRFTSIALGADGLPVVSYFFTGTPPPASANPGGTSSFNDLRVAKCNDPACDPSVNGAETISTLDSGGNVGLYTSIALGADGLPIVSYQDQTNFDLKVAKCNDPACDPSVNGAETVSTVDAGGDVGQYTSIALGADGLPVVSYLGSGDLRVAKCNDPACDPSVNGGETISTLDSAGNVGFETSLALGADGLPVVSYKNISGDLKVAKCDDAACVPVP